MSINVLTLSQITKAIENNEELMQLFNRDHTRVAFMTSNEFFKLEHDDDNRLPWEIMHGIFNQYAYAVWVSFRLVNRPDADVSLMEFLQRAHPGIALIESGKTVVEDLQPHDYGREYACNRYNPAFFPEGTLITLSRNIAQIGNDKYYPDVFVVKRVIQNGIDSFVLETTTKEVFSFHNSQDVYFKVNIEYVQRIVQRGAGAVKIERWRGADFSERDPIWAKDSFPALAKKKHWLIYSGWWSNSYKVNGMAAQLGSVIGFSAMLEALVNQPFVKELIPLNNFDMPVYLMSKKRAKRFIKQNFNRFLSSSKKAQKIADDKSEASELDSLLG